MTHANETALGGLHHVTAISGPAHRNLSFYVGTLGLRLVKKTVNFDDPATYHLYYGDEEGRPGSILTFFPWAYAAQGRAGTGMVAATAFAVPADALGVWEERLSAAGVSIIERGRRFDEELLTFVDPDGLPLELVGVRALGDVSSSGASSTDAIAGFHSVTLDVVPSKPTVRLLTDVLGYQIEDESDVRVRLRTPRSVRAALIDVLKNEEALRGRSGTGTVHHIAFRAASDEEQLHWKERLEAAGHQVTPVRDRQYFKSIYFREPGGVLFEIATDPPGFTLDEPLEALGTALKLPPWLESRRAQIEAQLDELTLPVR